METFLHSVRSSFQDLCLCLSGLVLACLLAVSVLRECRRFLCAHPWHVFLVLSVSSIYATVEARKPNGEDSEEAPARRQAAMVMRTGDGDLLPPVNGTAEPGLVIATLESTAPVVQAVASGVGTIRWKVKDSSFESRSEHPYYVILDEPQDPWSLRAGNEQNVRPAFLDVACGAAAGESAKPAALAKLTQHLFSGRGYLYEYHTGGSRRWDEDGPFDLSGYLFDDTPSFFGNPREVNCFDQGCELAFLARAIGIDADVEQVSNSDERLYIKESLIVGLGSETDNPFYRSGAPRCCSHRLCGSELHAEGVSRSSFTKHVYVLYGGRVFDACMGPCLGTQTRQSYFADRFEPGQILDTSTLGVSCGVK